jgi:hypothetical protein
MEKNSFPVIPSIENLLCWKEFLLPSEISNDCHCHVSFPGGARIWLHEYLEEFKAIV